jgi:hypothetical protein
MFSPPHGVWDQIGTNHFFLVADAFAAPSWIGHDCPAVRTQYPDQNYKYLNALYLIRDVVETSE